MSQFIQKVSLLCVLTLLSLHNILGVYVNIVNSLEDNLDLNLHCKSKDDDLGAHLLHHDGNFSFKFKPLFFPFGTTLFFCSFQWNGEELRYFDIYIDGDIARSACNYCNWSIFKSGPCRNIEGKEPICFPWNK
jgi:hypothetical protein